MKLNHVNLTVTDVSAAEEFLETYFGLTKMGGNAGMAFLSDGTDLVLSLMKAGRSANVAYPTTFHIGFFVGNEQTVDETHHRLTGDGFAPTTPNRHHGYGFYVDAPGGFTVEIGA